MTKCKALFLDLDGTVRRPISDNRFILDPGDQQIICGAFEAARHFYEQKYLIIGVTNQGGVEAGYKSLEDCIQEQAFTLELCPFIHKIYFCPDFEGKQLGLVQGRSGRILDLSRQSDSPDIPSFPDSKLSSFRKPGSGIIEYILETHDIDIQNSLFVGDRSSDRECIKDIECGFLWAWQWRSLFG